MIQVSADNGRTWREPMDHEVVRDGAHIALLMPGLLMRIEGVVPPSVERIEAKLCNSPA